MMGSYCYEREVLGKTAHAYKTGRTMKIRSTAFYRASVLQDEEFLDALDSEKWPLQYVLFIGVDHSNSGYSISEAPPAMVSRDSAS